MSIDLIKTKRSRRETEKRTGRAAVAVKETAVTKKTEMTRRQADVVGEIRTVVTNVWRTVCRKTQRIRRRWNHIVREKRAKNFPESERAVIQLLLFGWSMLPMVASLVGEALLGRRRRSIRQSGVRGHREVSRLQGVALLFCGCVVAGVALFFSIYTVGTTVTYDGNTIASVSSESTVKDARANLERITT